MARYSSRWTNYLGARHIVLSQELVEPSSVFGLVAKTAIIAKTSRPFVKQARENVFVRKMALKIPRSVSTWVSQHPKTVFIMSLPFLITAVHALNPDWDHPDPSLSRPFFGDAADECSNGELGDSIELFKFTPGYTAMTIGCRAADGSMVYNMVIYPKLCASAKLELNKEGILSFPAYVEGILDQSVQEYCAAPHRVLVASSPQKFLTAPQSQYDQIEGRLELPIPQGKEDL